MRDEGEPRMKNIAREFGHGGGNADLVLPVKAEMFGDQARALARQDEYEADRVAARLQTAGRDRSRRDDPLARRAQALPRDRDPDAVRDDAVKIEDQGLHAAYGNIRKRRSRK